VVAVYDADGNRVEKRTPPPPATPTDGTIYWYMTPGIVAESDLTGALKSEYVFFNGERVARRDFGPTGPTGVFYYFSDHLKTASVITDASGNIKSDSDYYPWGGELQFVANDSNHYKFTGKERDTETGLDYFGARYYSNGLGRFITPDWATKAAAVPYADFVDPQSLNLYAYVRDIPTVNTDADGHLSLGAGPHGENDFHVPSYPDGVCHFCDDLPMWILSKVAPGNAISTAYFNNQNKKGPPPPPSSPNTGAQSTPATPPGQENNKQQKNKQNQRNRQTRQNQQRLTNNEAKELADKLGYDKEVKDPPFKAHGNKVFTNGKNLITADQDAHSGGTWKVFSKKGARIGTYNADLTQKIGP
jgi:RHS repeat-associated protein